MRLKLRDQEFQASLFFRFGPCGVRRGRRNVSAIADFPAQGTDSQRFFNPKNCLPPQISGCDDKMQVARKSLKKNYDFSLDKANPQKTREKGSRELGVHKKKSRGAELPKGRRTDKVQSRLKFSISLEIFNLA